MPTDQEIIKKVRERYEREMDRYLKLAARVADICRNEIVIGNAIRAQVTFRGKSADSLEKKLIRKFEKMDNKESVTEQSVFDTISDLAGVRIATYRQEDEDLVCNEVKKRFCGDKKPDVDVDKKDKLEEGNFYRAIHCQVALSEEELIGTYENLKNTSCEIQICSIMAHVFNEIEHDIQYKPQGDGPQDMEKGLIEALGHLTRTGDKVISQLLAANELRLKEQTGEFHDNYDFVARLRKEFDAPQIANHSWDLFNELQLLQLKSLDQIKENIGKDKFDITESKRIIKDYNSSNIANDFLLDENSSDLILALLLEKYADDIEANHPVGRPPRIRSIASRYKEYMANRNQPGAELITNT